METLSKEQVEATVNDFCRDGSIPRFSSLLHRLNARSGRLIDNAEKHWLSMAILRWHTEHAHAERMKYLDNPTISVKILMAYSNDYDAGQLCAEANRSYALRHRYPFICETISLEDMLREIFPKQGLTWHKVLLINQWLQSESSDVSARSNHLDYIAWIDSDAAVVDPSVRLEDIIIKCGYRELIIAEDMYRGCLLNTGVMLIRRCDWSRQLWSDIWASTHHNNKAFYEQSALIKCLRMRNEGLCLFDPFHTFLPGARRGDKLLPHVAVLPHFEFNTNAGWVSLPIEIRDQIVMKWNHLLPNLKKKSKAKTSQGTGDDSDKVDAEALASCASEDYNKPMIDDIEFESLSKVLLQDRDDPCLPLFIFHPAGMGKKYIAILFMLQFFQISLSHRSASKETESR